MRNFLFKKKKGDANYISGLIVSTMLLVFTVACVTMYSDLTRAADIRSTCRGYMYTMEVNGCLTDANQALLKGELEEYGCKNINFTGTTVNEQTYGTLVTLCLDFDMPVSIFNLNAYTGEMGMSHVTFYRRTVSKN